MTQLQLIRQFKGHFSFRKSQEQQKVVSCKMSARRFDHMYKMSARRFDHISSDATTEHLFTFLGHELLLTRFISIWTLWQVHRNSRNNSSWFVASMAFILLSMKSEIDESVLCIISDVFVAVEVCTTAK